MSRIIKTHEQMPGSSEKRGVDYSGIADWYLQELETAGTPIRYYKGDHYIYKGTHYEQLEDIDLHFALYVADQSLSDGQIGSCLTYVNAFAQVGQTKKDIQPIYLGEGDFPQPKNIIAFENGLLDIDRVLRGDFDLLPHTPDYFSTSCLPYPFHEKAESGLWLDTINQIYDGDKGLIALLQEWLGYLIAGWLHHEKFMILTGKSRGGKGTVMTVAKELLGDAAVGLTLQQLSPLRQFGLESLINAKLALVSEVNIEGTAAKQSIMQTMKSMTGRDLVDIPRKYKKGISTVVPTRLMIACNKLPHFFDDEGALANRLLVIPHEISFVGREDRTLKDKLAQNEMPGIARWSLDGLIRLARTDQFTQVEASLRAKERFVVASNPVARFIRDRVVIEAQHLPKALEGQMATTDESVSVSHRDFQMAYEDWREGLSLPEGINASYLGRELLTHLPHLELFPHHKEVVETENRTKLKFHAYKGIRIKTEQEIRSGTGSQA
jgi:P4 family phage/plasmid primase-like protien